MCYNIIEAEIRRTNTEECSVTLSIFPRFNLSLFQKLNFMLEVLIMNCFEQIIKTINSTKEINNQIISECFTNPDFAFYGDLMNHVLSAGKLKISDVGAMMGLERRTFQYIRSRNCKKRREISLFEAVRFCIVMNFEPSYSLEFLKICGFFLTNRLMRDRIVQTILNSTHNNQAECNRRLDAINLVEAHYSDLNFDYLVEFKRLASVY